MEILTLRQGASYVRPPRRRAYAANRIWKMLCQPNAEFRSAVFGAVGEVAERSNATDCKSVGATLRWFESSPLHHSAIAKRLR